jgi:poly(ADP-ribose) glycohydrolase ARH3
MPSSRFPDIERLADRFQGALLGVAIGDALGAPLEGRPMRDRASLATWVSDPPHPLRYTDDTHMTLATASSLVECRGFDAEHMAQAMAAQYERQPWRGYGAGPPHVFREMRHGRRWEDAARELFGGTGSFGNGAAMRVTPIGLLHYREPKRAAEVARAAAQITHGHPVGQDGAGIVAAAVAEIVSLSPDEGLEPRRLLARMRDHTRTRRFRDLLDAAESLGPADEHTVVQVLGNGIEAHRSVATALYAFLRHHHSFQDAILFALSLGGDADTIASMTGALAGAAHGASLIPVVWAERVEGREELLTLAEQLLDLALGDAASTSSPH